MRTYAAINFSCGSGIASEQATTDEYAWYALAVIRQQVRRASTCASNRRNNATIKPLVLHFVLIILIILVVENLCRTKKYFIVDAGILTNKKRKHNSARISGTKWCNINGNMEYNIIILCSEYTYNCTLELAPTLGGVFYSTTISQKSVDICEII